MSRGAEVIRSGLAATMFGAIALLFSRLRFRAAAPRSQLPSRYWRFYWAWALTVGGGMIVSGLIAVIVGCVLLAIA